MCLLATLVVRLFVVFETSTFRVPNHTRNVFWVLFALLLLLACVILVSMLVGYNDTLFLYVVWLFLYVLIGGFAVYLFIRNLLGVAALQDTNSPRHDATRSNKHQLKMIALSTKYLALFSVAMLSTVVTLISTVVTGLSVADWLISHTVLV